MNACTHPASARQTVTLVDPFDELTTLSCSNEKMLAALSIVSDRLLEAMQEIHNPEHRSARIYESWLLLELTREYGVALDQRWGGMESGFLQVADMSKVERLRCQMRGA